MTGMRSLMLSTLLVTLAGAVLAEAPKPQVKTMAGRKVAIWKPSTPGPYPTVLFSHGFRGVNVQSHTILKTLTAAGYLVLAPDHQDAFTQGGRVEWGGTWTDTNQRNRGDDLVAVWKAALEDPELQPDPQKVALIGHSLGGYTVLGLGGAWPRWADPSLKPKAIVAWSAYANPLTDARALKNLRIPVMYQGGTQDHLTRQSTRAFEQTPEPKTYIEIEGARHLSWSEMERSHADLIARYTLAFLQRYVEGLPADPILTQKAPGISRMQTE